MNYCPNTIETTIASDGTDIITSKSGIYLGNLCVPDDEWNNVVNEFATSDYGFILNEIPSSLNVLP